MRQKRLSFLLKKYFRNDCLTPLTISMSLFSVQRFDSGVAEDSGGKKENQILQELHRRAASKAQAEGKVVKNEKKKRKLDAESESTTNAGYANKRQKQSPKEGVVNTGRSFAPAKKEAKRSRKNKEHSTETGSVEEKSSEIEESDKESDKSDIGDSVEENNDRNDKTQTDSLTEQRGQTHEEIGGFTVIGEVPKKWTQRVHRVLPEWLSRPSVVEADIRTNQAPLSSVLGLDDVMLSKLRDNNITSFFPVQTQVIPALLDGAKSGFLSGPMGYRPPDICCSAPTGSGKTLAFVIPIVQALKNRVKVQVRALAVLPTRDLANQVYKVFETFASGTGLRVGMAHGQKSFAHEQEGLVRRGPRGYLSLADVVIATPGRLVDHINKTQGFCLEHLRFLVIDEADRVMQEVQQDWLGAVERAVKVKHRPLTVSSSHHHTCFQKLLFSATLSQNPEKLQQLNLFQPKLFTSTHQRTGESKCEEKEKNILVKGDFIGKYTTPAGLTEYYITCTPAEKTLILLYYVLHLKFKHVLCFTNSIQSAHRLYWIVKLIGGIEVREMTRNLAAAKRTRILKQFAAGKIEMLVCSDAMARGMDVKDVKCVISYETTRSVDTYVHRVGRTARAGKAGIAFTLLEAKEVYHFKKLLKDAGKSDVREIKVGANDVKAYIPAVREALAKLPAILKAEKKDQVLVRKSRIQ